MMEDIHVHVPVGFSWIIKQNVHGITAESDMQYMYM